jgi:RecB family exonuclease
MVRITFGEDLDGALACVPVTAIGELTCGPLRLLSWLESQLGLKLPEVSFTSRMIQYLECLKREAPGRFYEKSLAQDEFATARTLLQWRDTWYEAGWRGEAFPNGTPSRLADIAAVEQHAAPLIHANTGQRLQRVVAALASVHLNVTLTVLDPPDAFAGCWRQLLAALNADFQSLALQPAADPDTDLGRLQHALTSRHEPGKKVQLKGDGSFLVLRDGSAQLSAPWIARYAHAHHKADRSVALLTSAHATTLDDALADAGQPRLGFTNTSFWRPVFQVLPLALELGWHPLDPSVLLQFLTHPMAPIRARIRRPLAEVVARQPGIGSEAWYEALAGALNHAVEVEPEDSRPAKRTEVEASVNFWLNSERFDAKTGAPVEFVLERVRRVSEWLARAYAAMGDADESALYAAALGQADELVRTLERLADNGTQTLTRIALRRLVEAIRGNGAPMPGRPWQCAPGEPQLLRADTPAGFIAPVPTVIWWACDTETLPRQHPWSRLEREALAANGIELLPLETALHWQAASWLRPLLYGQDKLVLVLHDNADGHHPVFDQIVAVAEGWAEARVDELMREPDRIPGAGELPATSVIAPRALPEQTRWWRLPDHVPLPPRAEESFSSLEKFLYGPHRWVLDYAAKIRPGALEALDDGTLLRGNLTHALFERYFQAHPDIPALDEATAQHWARADAATLIEQQGAVLLAPGRQAEKEQFITTVARALGELVRQLKLAHVTNVRMESRFEGRFNGGAIAGFVDLIATKATGETAVLDLKWGGFNYRRDMLVESSYLQLAVYAQLVHQNEQRWPALGYFIVRDSRLLVLDSDFFPEATVEQPANGENALQFWQRVEASWQWRREQLDRGLIEVSVGDTEPDGTSNPGDLALVLPDTFDSFDDYRALTGWRSDA